MFVYFLCMTVGKRNKINKEEMTPQNITTRFHNRCNMSLTRLILYDNIKTFLIFFNLTNFFFL